MQVEVCIELNLYKSKNLHDSDVTRDRKPPGNDHWQLRARMWAVGSGQQEAGLRIAGAASLEFAGASAGAGWVLARAGCSRRGVW